MQREALEAAVGRWPAILRSAGLGDEFLRNRHGPCPVCGGKDRYRFDDREGRGTWFCNRCGAGDGASLLMRIRGTDFRGALEFIESQFSVLPTVAPKVEPRDNDHVLRAWAEAGPIRLGDEVDTYLRSRGVGLDRYDPQALRFHGKLGYYDGGERVGMYACMLGAVTDAGGRLVGLHRTYLKDGRKASVATPKKAAGKLAGGSIKLVPAQDVLAVAEGIETALAVHKRLSVPAWSAVSADGLEKFTWPAGTRRLIVAGDNDSSFTGQRAAYSLAFRAKRDGLEVEVLIPAEVDTDWADRQLGETQ